MPKTSASKKKQRVNLRSATAGRSPSHPTTRESSGGLSSNPSEDGLSPPQDKNPESSPIGEIEKSHERLSLPKDKNPPTSPEREEHHPLVSASSHHRDEDEEIESNEDGSSYNQGRRVMSLSKSGSESDCDTEDNDSGETTKEPGSSSHKEGIQLATANLEVEQLPRLDPNVQTPRDTGKVPVISNTSSQMRDIYQDYEDEESDEDEDMSKFKRDAFDLYRSAGALFETTLSSPDIRGKRYFQHEASSQVFEKTRCGIPLIKVKEGIHILKGNTPGELSTVGECLGFLGRQSRNIRVEKGNNTARRSAELTLKNFAQIIYDSYGKGPELEEILKHVHPKPTGHDFAEARIGAMSQMEAQRRRERLERDAYANSGINFHAFGKPWNYQMGNSHLTGTVSSSGTNLNQVRPLEASAVKPLQIRSERRMEMPTSTAPPTSHGLWTRGQPGVPPDRERGRSNEHRHEHRGEGDREHGNQRRDPSRDARYEAERHRHLGRERSRDRYTPRDHDHRPERSSRDGDRDCPRERSRHEPPTNRQSQAWGNQQTDRPYGPGGFYAPPTRHYQGSSEEDGEGRRDGYSHPYQSGVDRTGYRPSNQEGAYSYPSGSSAYPLSQQAQLVTALTLPTDIRHLYPHTPDWKKLISYVQLAIANRSDLRIEDWNSETRSSLHLQWSLTAPVKYKDGPERYGRDHWMKLSPGEFLQWLVDSNRSGKSRDNRIASMQIVEAAVHENPFAIDFSAKKPNMLTDNPILRATAKIMHAYEIHVAMYPLDNDGDNIMFEGEPGLSQAEQKSICDSIMKTLDISGLTRTAHQRFVRDIKETASADGSGTKLRDMLKLINCIFMETSRTLKERRSYHEIFCDSSSSSRHKSDREEKTESSRREGRGDRSPAVNPSVKRGMAKEPSKDKSREREKNKKRCGYTTAQNKDYKCPRDNCAEDPRRNKSNCDWASSSVAKEWAKFGVNFLPKDATCTLTNVVDRSKSREGTTLNSLQHDNKLSDELIPFSLLSQEDLLQRRKDVKSGKRAAAPPPVGKLLLDTGALGSNVMSERFAKQLRKHSDCFTKRAAKHSIVTANKNKLTSNKIITVTTNWVNERTELANKPLTFSAAVAPIAVDVIIDRQTIKDNNLVQRFPSHFAQGELLEQIKGLPLSNERPKYISKKRSVPSSNKVNETELNVLSSDPNKERCWAGMHQAAAAETKRSFCRSQAIARLEEKAVIEKEKNHFKTAFLSQLSVRPKALRTKKSKAVSKKNRLVKKPEVSGKEIKPLSEYFLAALRCEEETNYSNLSSKSAYEREGRLALDEIPGHKLESVPAELINSEEEPDAYLAVLIGDNDPALRTRLRNLVEEFKDIFKSTVQRVPSSAFEPFVLVVDDEQWNVNSNATPPRTSGLERERELDKMLTVLEERGLIENCSDAYYSHAFLTPKSNGKWRLVLDFKGLNRATTSKYAWPIPNIKDMLNRVGDSRPSLFAVFDLTSGYYQAPIAEESRKYTAFKTRKGVYRWKLPMGLTGRGYLRP